MCADNLEHSSSALRDQTELFQSLKRCPFPWTAFLIYDHEFVPRWFESGFCDHLTWYVYYHHVFPPASREMCELLDPLKSKGLQMPR